jgi:hypothetical protein
MSTCCVIYGFRPHSKRDDNKTDIVIFAVTLTKRAAERWMKDNASQHPTCWCYDGIPLVS